MFSSSKACLKHFQPGFPAFSILLIHLTLSSVVCPVFAVADPVAGNLKQIVRMKVRLLDNRRKMVSHLHDDRPGKTQLSSRRFHHRIFHRCRNLIGILNGRNEQMRMDISGVMVPVHVSARDAQCFRQTPPHQSHGQHLSPGTIQKIVFRVFGIVAYYDLIHPDIHRVKILSPDTLQLFHLCGKRQRGTVDPGQIKILTKLPVSVFVQNRFPCGLIVFVYHIIQCTAAALSAGSQDLNNRHMFPFLPGIFSEGRVP